MNLIEEGRMRAEDVPQLKQLGLAAAWMRRAADALERLGYTEPEVDSVVVIGGQDD